LIQPEKTGIEIQAHEEIAPIRMSRKIGGKPAYRVASYLVEGLLPDTGGAAIRRRNGSLTLKSIPRNESSKPLGLKDGKD
jgi:hypothetical protein